jgi:hypothetical protein
LLAWNLYAKKKALESIDFLAGRIKNVGFDAFTPTITLELIAQNTSNHIFTVNSIAGNVFTVSNGKNYNVGNVSEFLPITIPANSQTPVVVTIRLQLIGVVTDLLNAILYGNFPKTISLVALANVDNIQIPINFDYTIGT